MRPTARACPDRSRLQPARGTLLISAKNWFKGPVRMGTEEELERMEEETLGSFDLPTEEPA